MWYLTFSLLILAIGNSGGVYDCDAGESEVCDYSLYPQALPKSNQEIKEMCQNLQVVLNCIVNFKENCQQENIDLTRKRKELKYIQTLCEEDNPAHKVLSRKIACIQPVARFIEKDCNWNKISHRSREMMKPTFDIDAIKRADDGQYLCSRNFWSVTCVAQIISLECGSETKDAVADFVQNLDHSYEMCTEEMLAGLSPAKDVIEFAIAAEHSTRNS